MSHKIRGAVENWGLSHSLGSETCGLDRAQGFLHLLIVSMRIDSVKLVGGPLYIVGNQDQDGNEHQSNGGCKNDPPTPVKWPWE